MNNANTTSGAASTTTLTLESLRAAVAKIDPEPIGEWMRAQGFPPERCLLVLPAHMKSGSKFWPSYVRFSAYVNDPVLVQDVLRGTQPQP